MSSILALGNRVAVFLAVTASAHINEPIYTGLRGSKEKSRNFLGGCGALLSHFVRRCSKVTPAAEPSYGTDLV
jgi:hypothetical protein